MMGLYSIKDTVKNEMSPPFVAKTDGQAWREYNVLIANDKYARDNQHEFLLYKVGAWNEEEGFITDAYPEQMYLNIDQIDDLLTAKGEIQ